jgi:hypothetical protein
LIDWLNTLPYCKQKRKQKKLKIKGEEIMTGQKDIHFAQTTTSKPSTAMNIVLWIVQVLLAALFLFGGIFKLVAPIEEMTKQMPGMPGMFLRFIGVCETLGGLGLILPGLLRIKKGLTPLAAIGLTIITLGATVITITGGMGAMAAFPFVTALLCFFIAYSRRSDLMGS